MIVTIIVPDNLVLIDGIGLENVDISSLKKKNIHSIHWNNDKGYVEYSDGKVEDIEDTQLFASVVTNFKKKLTEKVSLAKKNKPEEPFKVWSDDELSWVIDYKKYEEYKKEEEDKNNSPGRCHKWDDIKRGWVVDETCVEMHKAKRYLRKTDWYYARKLETGEDIPADILENRKQYRDYLREQGYSQTL